MEEEGFLSKLISTQKNILVNFWDTLFDECVFEIKGIKEVR